MVFFSLSSTRIEYYSLPALPALALILGWRLDRSLEWSRDIGLLVALFFLGLLGLALMVLLPYLEQICAANRREFFGMFPLIQPVARQASFWIAGLALGGILAGWCRPGWALSSYGLLALAFLFFTWKTLTVLSPLLSDQLPGEYIRQNAAPQDVVVMEAIEEFEYGASLAFYSGHQILMVQRRGLPRFPYPVPPRESYLITPAELRQRWEGPQRVFLLIDDVIQPESFLRQGRVVLELPGKRLWLNRP
jgi:hypothetical protein